MPPESASAVVATSYLDLVQRKVVVFDGATGTYLQGCELTADDFRWPRSRGLQRDALPHASRRHPPDAHRLLRCRSGRRRDNSFGSGVPSASTASPIRPTSSTWSRPRSPERP